MQRPQVITLNPGSLTLTQLRRVYLGEVRLALDDSAYGRIDAAQKIIGIQ